MLIIKERDRKPYKFYKFENKLRLSCRLRKAFIQKNTTFEKKLIQTIIYHGL